MEAVRPAQTEVGTGPEGLVEPRYVRASTKFAGESIATDGPPLVAERPFGIPDVKAELRPGFRSRAALQLL